MSYRELRNFTEIMRALGYPRLISMENFRNPNFPLISETLHWLVKRYDPSADIPEATNTEQERILFIKAIAQFMATKANLKLNTKKLYMADGHAVQEILKVSQLLYEAMSLDHSKEGATNTSNEAADSEDFSSFDISSKLSDLKTTRSLASEITSRGANVYDLLSKEIELRDVRTKVLAKQLEIPDIEKSLKEAIKKVEQDIQKTNNLIENVASDEASLDAKIEKRKAELERSQKRLQTLKSVRPAFMDEYEKLEQELGIIYEQYLVRFRSLAFLDHQLSDLDRHEKELMEERERSIRKMVEKMRQEELLRAQETSGTSIDELGGILDTDLKDPLPKPRRPNPASGMRRPAALTDSGIAAGKRLFGSMTGGERDDSLESDSDLDLDGDDDEEDASEISDDDLDMEDIPIKKSHHLSLGGDSDNDF